MKQLSIEGQIDIEEAFKGKLWAYVAVIQPNGIGLGVAVANEKGYCPVPLGRYIVPRLDQAEAEAERLNEGRGMCEDEALLIVTSTMGGRKPKPDTAELVKICDDAESDLAVVSDDIDAAHDDEMPLEDINVAYLESAMRRLKTLHQMITGKE